MTGRRRGSVYYFLCSKLRSVYWPVSVLKTEKCIHFSNLRTWKCILFSAWKLALNSHSFQKLRIPIQSFTHSRNANFFIRDHGKIILYKSSTNLILCWQLALSQNRLAKPKLRFRGCSTRLINQSTVDNKRYHKLRAQLELLD